MAKTNLKLVTPATVKRTVAPKRLPNAQLRTREHLTEAEVERLMRAAGKNRWGHRDATMILVVYRHGLQVSELVDLRWDQVDFGKATLHVRRVKQGTPSTHPILGDELRALRRFSASRSPNHPSSLRRSVERPLARLVLPAWLSGRAVALALKPIRTCSARFGFKLANDGHDTRSLQAYLGHKNIQHTVRYTELAPTRFKDFWRR